MSDFNPFAQVSSFFFPNEQGTNLKLREKIALAQMMRKQAYPKTLGEGFASIGDSISDVITARGLEKSDREAQAVAAKLGAPQEAGAITPVSYAPQEDVPQEKTLTPPIAAAQPAQPSIVTPPQQLPVVAPAEPLPASELPSNDPNAPYRLTNPARLDNWRRENPVRGVVPPIIGQPIAPSALSPVAPIQQPAPPAPLPEQPPAQGFNDRFNQAFPGRRSAAEPPAGAGVMAFGGEPSDNVPSPVNPRDLVAATLAKRGAGGSPPAAGGPPAAFAPVAPDQGIKPAPPDAFQRVAQAQPQAIPGYVPPELADPARAVVIPPSKRERELQLILNANQGNPYAATGSPAAMELQNLQTNRAKQQALEDKKTEAAIARTTKRMEQTEAGKMDQAQREAAVAETRQKLIDYGQTRAAPGGIQPSQPGQPDPRLGTQDSPQRSGIPTTPPVPAGVSPQKWAELQAPEHVKALSAVESATPDFQKMLDVIKLAKEHPGKEWGTGMAGTIARSVPGTEPYDFDTVLNQLKGKNFLAGYQKLKGGGAVSEIEGTKTEQAQARVDPKGSKENFNSALDDLEKNIRGDLEQVQRKVNQPVTAWQRSPNDPPAPDKGQIGTRGGKLVEYIGGDPSSDSSYKAARR